MRSVILAIAIVALAACHPDRQGAVGDGASQPEEQAEQESLPAAIPDQEQKSSDAAPVGQDDGSTEGIEIGQVRVVPDFRYTLRYDRVGKTSKTKRDQRQILIEAEVADGAEAMAEVVAAMEKAGYAAGTEKQQYGGTRVGFRQKGHPKIYVLVRESGSGPKIRNSKANATVYFTQIL